MPEKEKSEVQAVLALKKVWPKDRFEGWLKRNSYKAEIEEEQNDHGEYWLAVQILSSDFQTLKTRTTRVGLLFRLGIGKTDGWPF